MEGRDDARKKLLHICRDLDPQSVGLVGMQPAILEALVDMMGTDRLRCINRDEDNRNGIKFGVAIEWGDGEGLKQLFERSELILTTGSSAANGSLADILALADTTGKPVYFYGTTIVGTARFLDLDRLCHESQ